MAREINEESGLQVTRIRPIFSKTETTSWEESGETRSSNTCRIYFSAVVDGQLDVTLSIEHDLAQWVSLDQAEELLDYPKHKEVIQYILHNKLEL